MDTFVIEFFYDVVSPYSYLGFEQLVRLEEGEWRGLVTVVLRPFFLGAVMQATDNKPPALVPAKGRYMGRDLNRLSRALGLRVRIPSRFPALTLLAQRVLVALDRHDRASTSGAQGQRRLRAVSKRLWQIYWEEDGDLNDVPTLTAALVASGCTEEEAALLLQNAPSAEVKDELKAATDEAVKRGAFGAPIFFVRRASEPTEKAQMYFGADRFHLIAAQMGREWHFAPQKNNRDVPRFSFTETRERRIVSHLRQHEQGVETRWAASARRLFIGAHPAPVRCVLARESRSSARTRAQSLPSAMDSPSATCVRVPS